jgi:hypothetical protein
MRRVLSIAVALVASLAFAQGEQAQRYAVVVGSNAPVQERPGLRYSHRDARAFAQVLLDVGRFDRRQVSLLLDPTPQDVLAALDAAISQARAQAQGRAMLVFYYSGHADAQSLFPNGEALSLSDLKHRLSSEQVDLRVGIIDGCRGGGWTQAKGLAPTAPFAVGLPQLESEGTVLLASSSGLEDAHEADLLQGSFFTHHLVAGLRGAADQNRDAQVTLAEAFAYANQMTIRDTAQMAKVPQHPSFDMRLRGRQDVVLTALASSGSSLTVVHEKGPLQVVALGSGQLVAESRQGKGSMTLAVPAGDYLVRRVDDDEVVSRKVTVEPLSSAQVDERDLIPVDNVALAAKGTLGYVELPPALELAAGGGLLTDSGVRPSVEAAFTWRLSRKLSWRALRFQYGFDVASDDSFLVAGYPTVAFRLGTDLVFTFYRSEQLPKGFRFEGLVMVGPSLIGTSQKDLLGVQRGWSFGPSVEVGADFRLPYLGDVHLRPSFGTDVLFAVRRPAMNTTLFRFQLALAWRFGSKD